MIDSETESKILRLHFAEKWPIGTIAAQLGVHHSTVRRVLVRAGVPEAKRSSRASMVEPFLPFVLGMLEKYPQLTASRLYQMVRERGYRGGEDHFRHLVALHRPRRAAEAYLRLKSLPGEQGQVDWAHFGKTEVGAATRPLMAFVMVLSWSRQVYLRFFLDQRMESFLRGHVGAFQDWNGLPRTLLYDNLKSAVLERKADAIRFHPTLLELAGHYRFEPRPVAIARGNEKGRVERVIRYVRTSFFAARKWRDLDDLNEQAQRWCQGTAAERPCPEDKTLTVGQAYQKEKACLLRLPDNPFACDERLEVKVGKTPYVRFDRNDYSVPHDHVRRLLTVLASEKRVRVLDGAAVVADHGRSYSKGEQIEQAAHIEALVAQKREARQHRGMDRLAHACPSSQALLAAVAQRGQNIGSATSQLLGLLERYPAAELERAIANALDHGSPHPHTVRLVLERKRQAAGMAPPVGLHLPDDPRVRDLNVKPHNLQSYDDLKEAADDDNRSE